MLNRDGFTILSTLSPATIKLLCRLLSTGDLTVYRYLIPGELATIYDASESSIDGGLEELIRSGIMERGPDTRGMQGRCHYTVRLRREYILTGKSLEDWERRIDMVAERVSTLPVH